LRNLTQRPLMPAQFDRTLTLARRCQLTPAVSQCSAVELQISLPDRAPAMVPASWRGRAPRRCPGQIFFAGR